VDRERGRTSQGFLGSQQNCCGSQSFQSGVSGFAIGSQALDERSRDSIDIGFHFPGRSRLLQSRSLLVQIRFYQDPLEKQRRVIGVETAGYDHNGKQWQLSTIENWQFVGNVEPIPEMKEKLKHCCRQTLELFDRLKES
jgi:hypothetical protein